MYCPSCGTDTGDAKYCQNCGENIKIELNPDENTIKPQSCEDNGFTSKYSVTEFVRNTMQKDSGDETFELENDHLLDVKLNGRVWAKKDAMIAYTGDVHFKREGSLEHGLGKFVKKAVTGEATTMMKMDGYGQVYLADNGKTVTILNLQNERIYVNGNDVLAFEDGIEWDIKIMSQGSSMMSGGLFNIKLEGTGMVAITTHYTPLTLEVKPGHPVMTDPNATVAWSGEISPSLKTNIDFKTLIGKGSGETYQMKFEGEGFVILQPYEEVYNLHD